MKNHIITILLLAALILSSCGTLKSRQLLDNPDPLRTLNNEVNGTDKRYLLFCNNHYAYCKDSAFLSIPSAYSGVKQDFLSIFKPCYNGWGRGDAAFFFNALYVLEYPFFIIDLPLSFVADTVLLPVTVHEQNKYGDIVDPPYFRIGQNFYRAGNVDKAVEQYEKGVAVLAKYKPGKPLYDASGCIPDLEEIVRLLATYYDNKNENDKAFYYYSTLMEMDVRYHGYPHGPLDKNLPIVKKFCSKISDFGKSVACYEMINDCARRQYK